MWKPVIDYEGFYEVSDEGEVRSIDRLVAHPKGPLRIKGRVLKQSLHGMGYLQVTLAKEGGSRTHLVHELVLEAFVSRRSDENVTRHRDNNKRNNRVENLHWGTQGENLLDRVEHGTSTRGETHWNAKLSASDVSDI